MSIESDFRKQMYSCYNTFSTKISRIRVDILTPDVFNCVSLVIGTQTINIRSLASLSNYDNRTILVEVWDNSNLPRLIKTIQKLFPDFSLRTEYKRIYISSPPLTEERRISLSENVKSIGEDTKINLRKIRQKFIKLSEGQNNANSLKKKIQETLKDYEDKIKDLIKSKNESILNV